MDILTLFVIVPLVTIIALMFAKDMKQARVMAMIGMGIQFIMSVNLVFAYLRERASGNAAEMIFTKSHLWFDKFNIRRGAVAKASKWSFRSPGDRNIDGKVFPLLKKLRKARSEVC